MQHLLVRSKAGLSQHHLDRELRAQNMLEAFQVLEQPSGQALWLVDDILTTGATAIAAYQALVHRGYKRLRAALPRPDTIEQAVI